MSAPPKGSIIIADGNKNVTFIEPTNDNQLLCLDSTHPKGAKFINLGSLLPNLFFKAIATDTSYVKTPNYNIIMALTVPESNFTNNNLEINDMGTLSNLPTDEAIFEIQARRIGGNDNNSKIYIKECTISYKNLS